MDKKLTLNLDQHIIEVAKEYAKNQKLSLSSLIENYLLSIVQKENKETKVSPLVESLTGVIPNTDSIEFKKDYSDFLTKKYS